MVYELYDVDVSFEWLSSSPMRGDRARLLNDILTDRICDSWLDFGVSNLIVELFWYCDFGASV